MSNVSQIWDILDEYFIQYPQDIVGTVPSTKIEQAEQELGLKFDKAYKKFISKYGGGCIGSKLVYGLRKHKDMGELASVVDATKYYRKQGWPNIGNWYIVSGDFDGNPFGIDTEGKVWLSDHDSGFEQIKLADSFEEFLYRLHTDTLYE